MGMAKANYTWSSVVYFFIIPFEEQNSVKFSASPSSFKRFLSSLTERKNDLSQFLSECGELTEFSVEEEVDLEEHDDLEKQDDLDRLFSNMVKIRVGFRVTCTMQVTNLREKINSEELHQWIENVLVKMNRRVNFAIGFENCYHYVSAARMVEVYTKAAVKSTVKQNQQQLSEQQLRELEQREQQQKLQLSEEQKGQLTEWLEISEYLKLSAAERNFYTLIEFRLFIADIVKQVTDSICDALKIKSANNDADTVLEIIARHILSLELKAKATLVISSSQTNASYSIPRQLTGRSFYCLPTWKIAFVTERLQHFTYNYKVDNCMQSLQIAECAEMDRFVRSLGKIAITQISTLQQSLALSEIITKAAGKKSGAQNNSLADTESRTLSSDRRIRFDALLESHIDSVCGKSSIFWKVFAAHTVSLSLTDNASTLITSSDASTFIKQCYTNLSKWLKCVQQGDTKKLLSSSCHEFNSFVYRLSCGAFAEKLHLTDEGCLLICKVSLRVQVNLAPENKNFWKREEAELLLTCFDNSMVQKVGCDVFEFVDDNVAAVLSLCHCGKVLQNAERLAQMLSRLGVRKRLGERFSATFTEAAKKIGLLRSLSEEQFVSIAALLFNDSSNFDGLELMVKDFLETKYIDQMYEAFENSKVCSQSLRDWVTSYCAKQVISKNLGQLKNGVWKRFCDIWPLVKKLQCVSDVWESEAVPAVQRAMLASVSDTKYPNDASQPNRKAFHDLINTKSVMTPEFTVQLLHAIFMSRVEWLVRLCLEQNDLLHLLQQAEAENETEKVVKQFIRQSCDMLHKCVTEAVCSLVEGECSAEFRSLCLRCAASVLSSNQLTRGTIEANVEKVGSNAELLEVVLQACWEKLQNGDDSDAVVQFFQTTGMPQASSSSVLQQRILSECLLRHIDSVASQPMLQKLESLLEKHFLWQWILQCSNNSQVESSVSAIQRAAAEKLSDIRGLSQKLQSMRLTEQELNQFKTTFDRLNKSQKLPTAIADADVVEYFDQLLAAIFGDRSSTSARDAVTAAEAVINEWNKQVRTVEQSFNFLFTISGDSSPLKLHLVDIKEVQAKFRNLMSQYSKTISEMRNKELLVEIFDIRDVSDISAMTAFVQSELFRNVFVKCHPAGGASGSVFDAQPHHAAATINVDCSHVLKRMLPDAVQLYRQFWKQVSDSSVNVDQVLSLMGESSQLDFKLERDIVNNHLRLPTDAIVSLERLQQRDEWRRRMKALKFFLTEFFANAKEEAASTDDGDQAISDDENAGVVSGVCQNSDENRRESLELINEFIACCDQLSITLNEYINVIDEIEQKFGTVNNHVWNVLLCLHECREETLPFLLEQRSSDFQQLLDSTDDTVDLSLSVINSLILLQQSLRSFLALPYSLTVQSLDQSLQKAFRLFVAGEAGAGAKTSGVTEHRDKAAINMIGRVKECHSHINSIKALHRSMGSRGETSKIMASKFEQDKATVLKFVIDISSASNEYTLQCTCAVRKEVASSGGDTEQSLAELCLHECREETLPFLLEQRSSDAVAQFFQTTGMPQASSSSVAAARIRSHLLLQSLEQLRSLSLSDTIVKLVSPELQPFWNWLTVPPATNIKELSRLAANSRKSMQQQLQDVQNFFESLMLLSLTCQQLADAVGAAAAAAAADNDRLLAELGSVLLPQMSVMSVATQLQAARNAQRRWESDMSMTDDLLPLLRAAAAAAGLRLSDVADLKRRLSDMRATSLKATLSQPAPYQQLLGIKNCCDAATALKLLCNSAVMRHLLLLLLNKDSNAQTEQQQQQQQEQQEQQEVSSKQLAELLQQTMSNYTLNWLRLPRLPTQEAASLFANCLGEGEAEAEARLATELVGCDCDQMLGHLASLRQLALCRRRLCCLRLLLSRYASCLNSHQLIAINSCAHACESADASVGQVSKQLEQFKEAMELLDCDAWRCVEAIAGFSGDEIRIQRLNRCQLTLSELMAELGVTHSSLTD